MNCCIDQQVLHLFDEMPRAQRDHNKEGTHHNQKSVLPDGADLFSFLLLFLWFIVKLLRPQMPQ